MRILHISDTHGFHRDIPANIFEGIDMVIHSGDCSNWRDSARNYHEVFDFLEWYKDVPVEHKIYVAGNHDTSIEKRLITKENFSDRGIVYLEHEIVEICDLKIFGSPYTPTYGDWSFMKSRNNMHKLWSVMPQDIDILITHGPPKGVRDLSENMNGQLEQCGDLSLMKWVASFRPKAHLFGHIHDMSGINNQGKSLYSKCPTIFSNGACVHDGKFDIGLTSLGNVITLKKQTMAQQTAVSKMETTQTAVEWLFQQIPFEWTSKKSAFEAFQQAKAMEKEQINDAVIYGLDEDGHTGDWKISVAQNYYNKTYNK